MKTSRTMLLPNDSTADAKKNASKLLSPFDSLKSSAPGPSNKATGQSKSPVYDGRQEGKWMFDETDFLFPLCSTKRGKEQVEGEILRFFNIFSSISLSMN